MISTADDLRKKIELLKQLSELDYALAEKSFVHFFKAAWKVLEPTTPLLFNWHHELIAEYLQATLNGDISRLIINVPPRYSKSILVTIMFPAWCWITKPSLRFISASYSVDLATKHGVDRRMLLRSDWYQAAWKDRFSFSEEQNQKTEYVNNHRGHMVSVGMLGTVTGKGGDYVLIDDPHNPKKAESDAERRAAINAFDSTFTTRLDNKKTGRIVVVMQRLHFQDLTGHLLAKNEECENWTHLCLPAEAPTKTTIIFPVSGKSIERKKGSILHPDREGPAELAKAKTSLGAYNYAGQYEQNPSPRHGGIFKRSYWRYYTHIPDKFDEVIQSWDMSFKELVSSDPVAGCVLGRVGEEIYVLDFINDQLGFRASCNAVLDLSKRWPLARRKYVEDKANGPAVADALRSKIPGLILINPAGSKIERAALVEPVFESGNVLLPHAHIAQPWVSQLIEQCAAFPRGANDDMVDALTQGVKCLQVKAADRLKALGKL